MAVQQMPSKITCVLCKNQAKIRLMVLHRAISGEPESVCLEHAELIWKQYAKLPVCVSAEEI
jgi:hypothetical protein